ncbi:hypothetical protein PPL_10086 [Heterostelium album PN500]|uniref:Uncharacterized protein n=1 Tax=Heterostelium pallidum (strain ATCC 26659 / Pp 5 / PN500) TaxID=670386 RepID=D3BQA3_HETP5|nr:hypothetical protein PPL_10086 [Heterostelium album PN500]EFA76323.1 hypothetical protein PPL_10086 [Heterostelium album PN500]|eukprot:XP_020428455.1 hypothetical protein PPL_10086 [Heterostelium album PN500]
MIERSSKHSCKYLKQILFPDSTIPSDDEVALLELEKAMLESNVSTQELVPRQHLSRRQQKKNKKADI